MKKGFTLVEVLITTVVLTGAILAIVSTIANSLSLQDSSKNFNLAMNAARAEIEKLRNQDFSAISAITGAGVDRIPFDPVGFEAGQAKGQIRITNADVAGGGYNVDLKDIRVVICWRQKGGRIIGEDDGTGQFATALNGALEGAEDANSNTFMDSPVVITTSIANRL